MSLTRYKYFLNKEKREGRRRKNNRPRFQEQPVPQPKLDEGPDLKTLQEEVTPFRRCKLVFIGKPGPMKQSLLESIFRNQITYSTDAQERVRLGKVSLDRFERIPNNTVPTSAPGDVHVIVWDYCYNHVNNNLQPLFFKDTMLYVVLFNADAFQNEGTRAEEAQYLRNVLNNKKILAPRASVLLVGMCGRQYRPEECTQINATLNARVINVVGASGVLMGIAPMFYTPVFTESGWNIDVLKTKIRDVIGHYEFLNENVPDVISQASTLLHSVEGREFIDFNSACYDLRTIGFREEADCIRALRTLDEKGLLTFIERPEILRSYVVLDPMWLIRACRVVFYNPAVDDIQRVFPFNNFDPDLAADYGTYTTTHVISKRLLENIWQRLNFPEESFSYLTRLLTKLGLISVYTFDDHDSYLTPCTTDGEGNNVVDDANFEGPYFILDFSGDYDPNIVQDHGLTFVKHMPNGFFEKLVGQCVTHSSSFGLSLQPIVTFKKARIGFGSQPPQNFVLSVVMNENARPVRIKVQAGTSMSHFRVLHLAKRVFSIAKSLKEDFYAGVEGRSQLALSLLFPSSNDELCEFSVLQQHAMAGDEIFSPSPRFPNTVSLASFGQWLKHEGEQLIRGMNGSRYSATGELPLKQLAPNKRWHIFMAYKETSAVDVVTHLHHSLVANGLTVFLDVNQRDQGNQLTADDYLEHLANAMSYCLVLSPEVFRSEIILREINYVLEHQIPVILLDHPRTGELGFAQFIDYRNAAPTDFQQVIDHQVASIPLQTRFHLQEAAVNKITKKVDEFIRATVQLEEN